MDCATEQSTGSSTPTQRVSDYTPALGLVTLINEFCFSYEKKKKKTVVETEQLPDNKDILNNRQRHMSAENK